MTFLNRQLSKEQWSAGQASEARAKCGCSGVQLQTPLLVHNLPGQNRLQRRVGQYADFLASMHAQLSVQASLRGLTERQSSDFSIALLDAWACVCDVLTFYQEQLAQESYLTTATEPFSIAELGRLVGYQLRPGVAASTHAVFKVSQLPGAGPAVVELPQGLGLQSVPKQDQQPQTFETDQSAQARLTWNSLPIKSSRLVPLTKETTQTYLQGTDTRLKPGDRLLFVELGNTVDGATRFALQTVTAAVADFQNHRTLVRWSGGLGKDFSQPSILAMRLSCSLFGHNAPNPNLLPDATRAKLSADIDPDAPGDWKFHSDPGVLRLDAVYPTILPGSLVIVAMPVGKFLASVDSTAEVTVARYTLSSKVTELKIKPLVTIEPSAYRAVQVLSHSESLELARSPITEPISGSRLELDTTDHQLAVGQMLSVTGKVSGVSATSPTTQSELVTVASLQGASLDIQPPLQFKYDRSAVSISANVVPVSHGESVREVLGSGDATLAFPSYPLSHAPLTYRTANNSAGYSSTLQIKVDGIVWREVADFNQAGPADRVYVLRTNSEQVSWIQFGDGVHGARVPTGVENIHAAYRKGLGQAGMIDAEQLTQLLSRPLGLDSVFNPLAAVGGMDPETPAQARQATPRTVLTLERLVSLADYENFASSFAGIAKARATSLQARGRTSVQLTIAGSNGATIPPTSSVYKNLVSAIHRFGDANIDLTINNFRKIRIAISGVVLAAPDRDIQMMAEQIKQRLRQAFSFESRSFGESITISEIIAEIHSVPGVFMVDLDSLRSMDDNRTVVNGRLLAKAELDNVELLVLEGDGLENLQVRL